MPASPFPLQILRDAKQNSARIAMISLYDAPTATLCCDAGVDIILVGDSLGNVILGHDNTLAVTVEDMARHTGAVSRGVRASSRAQVPVIADLPFGSYATIESATRNGAALLRSGAHGLKLEGAGPAHLAAVEALLQMGAPVMGHIGFTPQSSLHFGNVVQGKSARDAARLLHEAHALQAAGCCVVVLEAVPVEVAARITRELEIPTIGIGAGAGCDGQVLVWHDLTGLNPAPPFRFVKRYADAYTLLLQAAREFAADVHSGAFPTAEHGWAMAASEREEWEQTNAEVGARSAE
jgi:3-methyl-2-oxobutanoate hydroxymethyltransferase